MAALTNAHIQFSSGDDGKDFNTLLTVTVRDSDGQTAARISNTFGEFTSGANAGPFDLIILNKSPRESLAGSGELTIRIDPIGGLGHDTWRFGFALVLHFDDDSALTASGDGTVLDQDQREQTFAIA